MLLAPDVSIDYAGLVTFVREQLTPSAIPQVIELWEGRTASPLRFESVDHEVNFVALRALIQVGSGFRVPLQAAVNRGASDTIAYGCLSMHMEYGHITAKILAELTLDKVASLFGFDIQEEYEIQPGIRYAPRKFPSLHRRPAHDSAELALPSLLSRQPPSPPPPLHSAAVCATRRSSPSRRFCTTR